MNVLSREPKFEESDKLSRVVDDLGRSPWAGRPMAQVQRTRVVDSRAQQMRWIGVALCLVSAAVTLASATWIAVGF